jgi:hypothetical protein
VPEHRRLLMMLKSADVGDKAIRSYRRFVARRVSMPHPSQAYKVSSTATADIAGMTSFTVMARWQVGQTGFSGFPDTMGVSRLDDAASLDGVGCSGGIAVSPRSVH